MLKLISDVKIREAWYSKPNRVDRDRALAQAQLDADKEALSEWKDKPDSGDWWWFNGTVHIDPYDHEFGRFPIYVVMATNIIIVQCDRVSPFSLTVDHFEGKFCKAYVPEE
uniref:Uncharacterized protein n=1 Tax=viral metagenome TaxID=1070528 RepID=A0A6M3L1K4_9ZZZZ